MRFWKKPLMRSLCICLCLCLCAGPGLAQEEMVSALPTPTPLPPEGIVENEETPTPAPDSTQAPEESAPPAVSASPAATESPAASALPTASNSPEASESPAVSASPTASASPEASESPAVSASPTASASPEASASPSVTPQGSEPPAATEPAQETQTPQPSVEPAWDESLCDHRNENCTLPSQCPTPDCAHIGVNDAGDVVALCPLGQWMLQEADAQGGIMAYAASEPTAISLVNGTNLLYRSGSYVLTGGGENAQLYVRAGLAVSLWFNGAQLLTLRLPGGTAASLGFSGQSSIHTVAASGASLMIDGAGNLKVTGNFNCDDVLVLGGSVTLPTGVKSGNGRMPVAFSAPGAQKACLDGKYYCDIAPDASGGVTLWLPPYTGKGGYWGRMEGDTLQVFSIKEEPETDGEIDLSLDEPFAAAPGKSYRLTHSDASRQGRAITVDAAGVTLTLRGAGTASSAPTIAAGCPVDMHLSGENHIAAMGGQGPFALSGTGTVYVNALSAKLSAQGALTVCAGSIAQGALDGWQKVTLSAGSMTAGTTAAYGESSLPAAYETSAPGIAYVPLPAPQPGYSYQGAAQNGVLAIAAVADTVGETVVVGMDDVALGSGNYRLTSVGGGEKGIAIADGASVTLLLDGATALGPLEIGANATVRIAVAGSNALGTVRLGKGAALSIGGSGAVDASAIAGSDGASVTVEDKTCLNLASGGALPGSKLRPTVIAVTDENNAPMASRQVVLKLGQESPFTTFTGRGGRVTLWRKQALSGVDVVVLSDANTYAAVLNGGSAAPDALPKITNVKARAYGAVTFDTDTGNSLGVMYIVSNQEEELPDTWAPTAGMAYMQGGECLIPGVKPGDVVTFRAFACAQAGAQLTGDTADAFAFGDKLCFTVKDERVPLDIPPQRRTYNQKAFKLSAKLYPKDADVSYFRNGSLLEGAPVNVGDYIARVTVPAGNPAYLPGNYDVRMTIDRIKVMIFPELNMKQKGQPDPDFYFYTYDESAMLGDDQVTGELVRKKGETYGNYPYYTYGLSAPEYYELVIDPESPAFFIDWNIHHYLPYDPLARIDPVYDEVALANGQTLRAQLRTMELLRLDDTYYGSPVTDLADKRERPFTPSLRLRGGYDSALLILNAEAELNADGGYATDLDGNRIVRGRRLTVSYSMLSKLKRQHVDFLAFGLDGVMVLMDLDDLRDNPKLDKLMNQHDVPKSGNTRFQIDLEPVTSAAALTGEESSAAGAAQLGEKLMRVSARVSYGSTSVDIAPALTGAQVLFDASGLLEAGESAPGAGITETVNGKPVSAAADVRQAQEEAAIAGARGETQTNEQLLEVVQELLDSHVRAHGTTLMRYDARENALKTGAVVPYTASEEGLAAFRALMRTRPYLTAGFTQSGLYGLREQNQ